MQTRSEIYAGSVTRYAHSKSIATIHYESDAYIRNPKPECSTDALSAFETKSHDALKMQRVNTKSKFTMHHECDEKFENQGQNVVYT